MGAPISPEVKLFRAVVIQALLDLAGVGSTAWREAGGEAGAKQEAAEWFDLRNNNFLDVCTFAGLDCRAVARAAVDLSSKGDHARKISALLEYRASLLPS